MEELSYEQFGVNFVTQVVTAERVGATIARLAGSEVRAGPLQAGPGGAASVTAVGTVGDIRPQVDFGAERLGFNATIPIDLRLEVRVAGGSYRFEGRVDVPLRLDVRAAAPLTLVIDARPVQAEDLTVKLSAEGMRARVLQRLGNVDDEVRRTVAEVVNERLTSEEAMAVRVLDILEFVDEAWTP